MPQIILQVSTNLALSLHHRQPPTKESNELLRIAQRFGAPLEPLHPGEDDPVLLQYFRVQVADDAAAATSPIDELRTVRGVQSAYVQPRDAAP